MSNLIDPEFVAWSTQQRGAIGMTVKGGPGSGRYPAGSGGGENGSSSEDETISKSFTRENRMDVQKDVMRLGKEQLTNNLPDGFSIQGDGRAMWIGKTDNRKSTVSIRVVDDSNDNTVSANFEVSYTSSKLDPTVGRFVSVRGMGDPKTFSTLRAAKNHAGSIVDIEKGRISKP